jgi:hypothetical protein
VYTYNPNLLLEDHAIPRFLRIPQAQRNAAWVRNPPKPMPEFYERNATQIAYRQSIEDEKTIKRVLDEQRFRIMRERANAEKAERDAIMQAAKLSQVQYGEAKRSKAKQAKA